MKRMLLFFILLSLQSRSQKALSAEEIITANLKTDSGQAFRMYETRKYTATVFVFLLPDCPACENYARTLNQLREKYRTAGIELFGVFPSFVKNEAIKKYKDAYRIQFPLLVDFNGDLVRALDARVAPESFVLSESTVLLYRGRIDDWFYAVGRKRTVITRHELQDALDDIQARRKVTVSKTQAVGCLID